MEENETVPSDPATKIGAGSGRTTVELPPPLRLPNVGMGAFGFDQSGNAETASCISYDENENEENSTEGPFCKVYPEGENWKLLGGTVTSGGGTETIANITIGTLDTPPANGTFYWLACDVDANEEDDVLLPGGTLTAAATGSGTSLPGNTIPEVGAIEGTIHISLGEWMNGKFIPAGCGNLQISHCPGTLSANRY
jgi:hypothetical protein